jgi:hypothetical protein
MLTKEQIEEALLVLSVLWGQRNDDADEGRAYAAEIEDETERAEAMESTQEDQRDVDALKVALATLAAYERVTALAENLDTMTVLDQAEHRRNMQVAASIRRALEG